MRTCLGNLTPFFLIGKLHTEPYFAGTRQNQTGKPRMAVDGRVTVSTAVETLHR